MENTPPQPPTNSLEPAICSQCHQPVLLSYYFCPNCGKKVNEPPLSTGIGAQLKIYILSILLPLICYLAIGYWHGVKYAESKDPKARQIGIIAILLLLVSSAVTFWIGVVWIQDAVQSALTSVGSINGSLNGL